MLRTDLRVLDQHISSDLYSNIEKDRLTIQQLAQQDLDDLNMFRDRNRLPPLQSKDQHESRVDIDKAIKSVFYLDSMDIREKKEKIQILGFDVGKTADGNVIPFDKTGNESLEI